MIEVLEVYKIVHRSVLTSLGIQANSEELDLPYNYWIPNMHKNQYKHRFIAVNRSVWPSLYPFYSQNCLHLLSKVFRRTARQPSQEMGSIRCGSSRIQKNYWIILNLQISTFITNIKSLDFSTLYTTIPHLNLKSRLATIIRNSVLHKNRNQGYKYLVLRRKGPHFVKEHSDAKNKYTEEDIMKMLEFLIDSIFVVFAGKISKQIISIPMGTNCAPLLADIFLYSYEAEFIRSLLSAGKKRLTSQFNFTYR